MNDNPSGVVNPTGAVPSATPQATPTPQMAVGSQMAPGVPGSVTPTSRPMEQAAPMEMPKKKKKTGLIVGIIMALIVLIGGGVAAAIIIPMLSQKDPVTMAMEKIMSGKAPANVAIDGDIDIAISDQFSPVSNIKISMNSGLIPQSLINNSKAIVTASIRGIGDVSVEVDEIYANKNEMFFKIDGITNALEDSGLVYLLNMSNKITEKMDCGEDGYCQAEEIAAETNCVGNPDLNCGEEITTEMEGIVLEPGGQVVLDEDTMTFFASMVDAIEIIDGEWLRISIEDLGAFANGTLVQSDASCVADLVSTLNTSSNSAIEAYNKYPFITATDKDVDLAKKQYPVYKVSIDDENFTNYINSIQNTALSEKIYSCLNLEDNVWIDEGDISKIVEDMPNFYVEVDNENNFTRLYVKSTINSSDCACMDSVDIVCDCPKLPDSVVTMDLNFSYPDNINVPAPTEYRDFKDVIQDISTSIYEVNY